MNAIDTLFYHINLNLIINLLLYKRREYHIILLALGVWIISLPMSLNFGRSIVFTANFKNRKILLRKFNWTKFKYNFLSIVTFKKDKGSC